MADTTQLTKAVDVLLDSGVLLKDALNKSLFGVLGDLNTVLSDVSQGFDLPTLLVEARALNEASWQVLVAHITTKLPALGSAGLEAKVADGLNLAHDLCDWVDDGGLLVGRVRALLGV